MTRFRILVVFLLLACLPFKVVAAVVMPFCGTPTGAASAQGVSLSHGDHGDAVDQGHGDNGDTSVTPGTPGDPGAHHGQHAGHDEIAESSSDAAPATGDDCGQCGLCHLACASAIPMHIAVLKIRFAPVQSAALPASFVSFIPEVLFRPPLHRPMNALA